MVITIGPLLSSRPSNHFQTRSMKLTSLAQVLSFFLLAPCSTLAAEQSPNVVFVITDDQGYGDLGFTGNPVIKTPHLDKLAGESVWLEDFHVAPSCSPTRSSMLTGRWTNRTGVWHTFFARAMMYEDEVTIADHFQAAGYSTGMFGKWHLGDHYPYRPQDRGFDETYCIRGETAGGGVPAVSQTAEVASTRSGLLGVPVAILVELAIGARNCSTGNSHPLAPPGIQVVLALEISKRKTWTPADRTRDS